nr:MAG TPA: hypothetical protein [Caudoviricetes sp.]
MTAMVDVLAPAAVNPKAPLAGVVEKRVFTDVTCRIQELNRYADNVTGSVQDAATRDYLVQMPLRMWELQGGLRNHVLVVTASNIPGMHGKRFTVKQVMSGSLLGSIDLICGEMQNQRAGAK